MDGLRPVALVVLFVTAGCASAPADGPDPIVDLALAHGCPTHWHVGFDIVVPGPDGKPLTIDFEQPRWPTNDALAYYEFSNGAGRRAANMTLGAHLHMGGAAAETGASGPLHQIHMEAASCVGVGAWLHAIDVDIAPDGMALHGGHKLIGEGGSYDAADAPLRYWVQGNDGNWTRHGFEQLERAQLGDGWSLLVVYGDFDAATIDQLKTHVEAPSSRR